jgi:3-hydroxyacyl-CoA dehydrogenase / enoyl-CoA hydratase / 3-hydroxybutyryl-CoA epimerase
MNSESVARIICELPLDSALPDGIETALANPKTDVLLIEFHTRPDSEKTEIDQILAGDPLIGRLRGLLRQMEQGLKPIVALVFESIDGLQLEIALACHARFANNRTIKLGFPWIKYGLMPVVGGTQRLPRLCGIGLAARMLLAGERVTAAEATVAGLVDLSHHSLPEAALEWTKAHPEPRQPWDQVPQELSSTYSQSPSNRLILEKIYLKLRRRVTPEETAPTAILRCLQDGLERSIDAGIRLEAEQWSLVRRSRSTVSRVNTLYVARQKAIGRIVNQPISIKCLGVLGGGLMGAGIAYTAARAGCEVVLVDNSQAALDVSFHRTQKIAQQDANSGMLKNSADVLNRIHRSLEISALTRCDFIIEAIFERQVLKKAMLAAVATLADPQAILASNTTTLPISDLGSACSCPARFLGTHFFAPVDRMELLEIVVGEKTAPETVDRALVLAKALGKTPVIVRDGPGFFTSRVVAAYLQEALLMLREGVSPWLIDNVAQNAGMILGPLTVADLTSLDLLTDIFASLAMHRRGAARYAPESMAILKELTRRSRLGKKSRAGIYDYNVNQERVDSPEFARVFAPAADQPTAEEIEQRLFVVQTLEALQATREGIIEDAAMADLASVLGWSYPAHRGGVMSYIDFIGRAEFERVRARLQRKFGDRFALPG